jgi:putative selenium metabolism hydrolase
MPITPEQKDQTVELLQRLVRAASLTGQEKLTAEIAAAQMRALNFDRVWTDDFGNVIGERKGDKPGPALMFEAHMDVVEPGNLKEWTDDPYSGLLKDGKIYGRGATDTKGSLAGMITAVGLLPREDIRGKLYAVASVGEEMIEGGGLREVLKAVKVDGVVIGEPTGCKLAIGQKGRTRIKFTAHGKSAHTSTPENGENAVVKGAEIIRRVKAMPLPEAAWLGKGVMEPVLITSRPEPPATAIIPYECKIEYDRRLVPCETEAGILSDYRSAMADQSGWDVSIDELSYQTYTGRTIHGPEFHPAWLMDEKSAWVQSAADALKGAGIDPKLFAVPYCTNGSVSAVEMGLPTLIFGPSVISLAHIPNEYIPVEELLRGVAGYQALAMGLSTPESV